MTTHAFSITRPVPDTDVLTTHAPLPGLGLVPVNAFLIRAAEPVLVDTGLAALRTDFLAALESLIDPAALRWIWLTHADADHVGNLAAVLERAPQARVVTNYLGIGKLALLQLPVERARMLSPGEALAVGDRELVAQRMPVYDAPETMGLLDTRTRHLFTSDCFGAVLETPATTAEAVGSEALREGLQLWATIDAPWVQEVPALALSRQLRRLAALHPTALLSSHLPPATRALPSLLQHLADAGERPLFTGPPAAAAPQPAAEALVA